MLLTPPLSAACHFIMIMILFPTMLTLILYCSNLVPLSLTYLLVLIFHRLRSFRLLLCFQELILYLIFVSFHFSGLLVHGLLISHCRTHRPLRSGNCQFDRFRCRCCLLACLRNCSATSCVCPPSCCRTISSRRACLIFGLYSIE